MPWEGMIVSVNEEKFGQLRKYFGQSIKNRTALYLNIRSDQSTAFPFFNFALIFPDPLFNMRA